MCVRMHTHVYMLESRCSSWGTGTRPHRSSALEIRNKWFLLVGVVAQEQNKLFLLIKTKEQNKLFLFLGVVALEEQNKLFLLVVVVAGKKKILKEKRMKGHNNNTLYF